MKKIWFFGDCFTWGFGCRPGYRYYIDYKKDGDKLWPEIVSEALGREMVDKSVHTNVTNFETIKIFTNNLLKIGKEDIVVYATTVPRGVLKLNKKKSKVESLTSYDFELDKYWRDSDDKKIINSYIDLNITGHEEKWMEFFLPQIHDLIYILLERGIKTYLWSYELWDVENKFETISDATNKQIRDRHWSFKGHKEMANYILEMIKEDRYVKKNII